MTIKIVEEENNTGLYGVFVDGRREGRLYGTYNGAHKFAKRLANSPKPIHEWDVTRDSKRENVKEGGPKWWHWTLMILGTIAVIAISA